MGLQEVEHIPAKSDTLPVLVVGYGNTLRQDDAFGYLVAERLLQAEVEGIQVIACHQLAPELAEPLSRCQAVVFVDAKEGEPVGEIEWQSARATGFSNSTLYHTITPADLLLLAQTLYGSAPKQAYLLTIRSVHFDHAEGMSPQVQKGVDLAVAQIKRFAKNVVSFVNGSERCVEEIR